MARLIDADKICVADLTFYTTDHVTQEDVQGLIDEQPTVYTVRNMDMNIIPMSYGTATDIIENSNENTDEQSMCSAIHKIMSGGKTSAVTKDVLMKEVKYLFDKRTEDLMTKEVKKQNCKGVTIKIKTFGEGYLPEKIVQGDWIDLRARGEYNIRKGDTMLIKLGVAMELPSGYEAIVAPRSSMTKNFGIVCANSFGVIDHSYCGDRDEWGMFALAVRDTIIHDKDRICQFRIQENQPMIRFEKVESLGNPDRGGWGTTGMR